MSNERVEQLRYERLFPVSKDKEADLGVVLDIREVCPCFPSSIKPVVPDDYRYKIFVPASNTLVQKLCPRRDGHIETETVYISTDCTNFPEARIWIGCSGEGGACEPFERDIWNKLRRKDDLAFKPKEDGHQKVEIEKIEQTRFVNFNLKDICPSLENSMFRMKFGISGRFNFSFPIYEGEEEHRCPIGGTFSIKLIRHLNSHAQVRIMCLGAEGKCSPLVKEIKRKVFK